MNDKDLSTYLDSTRRDFSGQPFDESSVNKDPIKQFDVWFKEAVKAKLLDPYAMSVSTVNEVGQPSTRVVYLRSIIDGGFVFYTNYNSYKGKSIAHNNKVSLHFFWPELERQVVILGNASKVRAEDSDAYFSKRPRASQIGAWASSQSSIISNREALEDSVKQRSEEFQGKPVPRPEYWGGYKVIPTKMEFWQGRPSRLHDRLVFSKDGNGWSIARLSP